MRSPLLREVTETRLDASPFAEDTVQQQWLADAGYTKRRTWPQMTRPVEPEEATSLPGAARGRHHPPRGEPRERPAGRRRPAAGARDARVLLRGPLQLLPRELPGVPPAAARGPRTPLGPLVAGVRRGRRGPAARGRRRGRARCCPRTRQGHEGSYIDYIGVHRHARGRGHRQVAAPHRDRRRRAAWPRPGGARGRRRLADGCRRALPLDGLGDRLRDRVLVQGPRVRRSRSGLSARGSPARTPRRAAGTAPGRRPPSR